VLVVDDDEHIMDLMTIWLLDDPRCCGVDQASDIPTAQRRMSARCPDTILLDFNLGAETTASDLPSLRRQCPQSRIIVHTAEREAAHAAQVLSLGADLVLEKASVSIENVVAAALGDS
jgi:DNA-binding response OmpR family regulator